MSRLIVLLVAMGIAFIEDLEARQSEPPCEQTLSDLHGDAPPLGIPDRGTWKAEVDNEWDGEMREAKTHLLVVEFRVNGQRFESGDVVLAKGLYEVEIYTNHWGQPYLTYADVTILRKGDRTVIPFVNTASEIEAFRSQQIAGRSVVEVCDYTPRPVE